MKLLIIDDHAGQRSLIRQFIQKPGDEIVECISAEEALKIIKAFNPDWASIDFRLGNMNGVALTRSIRMMNPHTRCVLVSSYEVAELRTVALEAGAEGYIAKENLRELSSLIHASRAATTA